MDIPDIHPGAFANSLQTPQNLDGIRAVLLGGGVVLGVFILIFFFQGRHGWNSDHHRVPHYRGKSAG